MAPIKDQFRACPMKPICLNGPRMFYFMGMTRGRGIAIGLAALGLLVPTASTAAAGGGDPWVDLDGGKVGNLTWSVSAARSCLRVGTVWKTSPLSFLRQRNRACAASKQRPRP